MKEPVCGWLKDKRGVVESELSDRERRELKMWTLTKELLECASLADKALFDGLFEDVSYEQALQEYALVFDEFEQAMVRAQQKAELHVTMVRQRSQDMARILERKFEDDVDVQRLKKLMRAVHEKVDVSKLQARIVRVFSTVFANMTSKTRDLWVGDLPHKYHSSSKHKAVVTCGSFGFGWRPEHGRSRSFDGWHEVQYVLDRPKEIAAALRKEKLGLWADKLELFASILPELREQGAIDVLVPAEIRMPLSIERRSDAIRGSSAAYRVPVKRSMASIDWRNENIEVETVSRYGEVQRERITLDVSLGDDGDEVFVQAQLLPHMKLFADVFERETAVLLKQADELESGFTKHFGRELLLEDA